MLTRRLIACLDVKDGRVVKGVEFEGLRDVGDPVALAVRYEAQGADEICFLDITASHEARKTLLDVVRRTSEQLFIPLTVGGGVRDVEDVAQVLRAGADKVSINSALVPDPAWLRDAANRFGSQAIVASIDGKRVDGEWRVFTHGGRKATGLGAIDWARRCVASGAGEVLLTSMDRDGTRQGYDIPFTRAVSDAVSVPVIASGGAGTTTHLREAIEEGRADAVLLAGILHDDEITLTRLKASMADVGLPIRSTP